MACVYYYPGITDRVVGKYPIISIEDGLDEEDVA